MLGRGPMAAIGGVSASFLLFGPVQLPCLIRFVKPELSPDSGFNLTHSTSPHEACRVESRLTTAATTGGRRRKGWGKNQSLGPYLRQGSHPPPPRSLNATAAAPVIGPAIIPVPVPAPAPKRGTRRRGRPRRPRRAWGGRRAAVFILSGKARLGSSFPQEYISCNKRGSGRPVYHPRHIPSDD
ncbi:hypothetical protein B0T22DRAFT_156317 [Podospora appendiculata]|uniref:Uncharacterized protein n=1 Tax=Podospora appendiculata TaxID=314037 RepID=A0AAE0X9G6_9PEZI|nr:hypothetical protein B0T22DRAFT_156317 [Podospora appendiculata]